MAPRDRLDSKLAAAGAEHLVLGRLLIAGMQSYQAYTNQRDYDIIATAPDAHRSCRIQVKSRWATDANLHFPLSKTGFDFAVFVALNRGIRYRNVRAGEQQEREPDYWVIPVDVVLKHQRVGKMSVLRLRDIPDRERYLDAWYLVGDFLGCNPAAGD